MSPYRTRRSRRRRSITRAARVAALGACNTFWGDHGPLAWREHRCGRGARCPEAAGSPHLRLARGRDRRWGASDGGPRPRCEAPGSPIRSRDAGRRLRFEEWTRTQGVELVAAPECQVLINTTPLGLSPGDHLPVALEEAPRALVAFDMVYNKGETAWIPTHAPGGDCGPRMVGACWSRRARPRSAVGSRRRTPPVEVMRAAVNDALR